MARIKINRTLLNYREVGNRTKPTIVLSHLVLFDSSVFNQLFLELGSNFHLIILDLHGHGESGYRSPLTLEEMAEDYFQLLTRLGISRFSWIGYSVGGMLGLRLVLQHPEAIESLILIAAIARLDPPELGQQTLALWQMFRDGHREDIVDAALRFLFAPATFEHRPELIATYRNKVTSYDQAQAQAIFEVVRSIFNRSDISEEIAAIQARTLVLGGKKDITAPPEELETIASRIPNATLAIVDDASHLLVVEQPQKVAQLIGEFLKNKNFRKGHKRDSSSQP